MTPDHQPPALVMPPHTLTADGEPRLIGVEIEFGGLTLEQTSIVLVDHLGGELAEGGRYEAAVRGDPAGDWLVELDFELLKELGRREHYPADADFSVQDLIKDGVEQVLKLLAEPLVPVEIISPPLPLNRLEEIQPLISRLRDAGALGTSDNPVYAFGLQLNPQLPALDVSILLRLFKAYLCLADWLRKRVDVDLTRRLTLFAEPFPRAYVRTVVDPHYWPDLATFIDDYLAANPTRNRELDLLPLLMHLDAERVTAVVQDTRVKARPTFHYRLPNSEIDLPDWGLHHAWNDWVQVERLAAEPERLGSLCQVYCEHLDQPFGGLFSNRTQDWASVSEQWLMPNHDH